MWVAKIQFSSQGTLIGSKAVKNHVSLFSFVLSFFYTPTGVIVHMTGTLVGSEHHKKEFIKELKNEKRVHNFEVRKDFFVGTIEEPLFTKEIYNKDILQISPMLISHKGFEVVTLGCFKRVPLVNVANILKKERGGRLVFIQKKKLKSISVMRVHPDITEKQKKAMMLAVENGYYHSPRKIDVQTLSKMAKLSFSTFQVHLRKAEAKLIPYFFE